MEDECDVSEIVTAFLLNTCRLCPRISNVAVEAAIECASEATNYSDSKAEPKYVSTLTGSAAEFYIEPMLPNVSDLDVMVHSDNALAIPRRHPLSTLLPLIPAEFQNKVHVAEIIDSHLPGYVYLALSYLLTRCSDDVYICVKYDEGLYYYNRKDGDRIIHGPAFVFDNSGLAQLFSVDQVRCVRCLSWPSQAADWPTRHRNYGWPDSATLDRVASNGCDVVCVAHRQCRQDAFMGKYQWRLSFSRAEIVLTNSWMPVQQIVYHMLRYYMKTEQLTDSADNPGACTLSNYHIKTLMLWACELKLRSWWTENLNLVRICVELLQTLSVWLTETRCPHYFINDCNLLDNSLNLKRVASKLMSIDEESLSTWFVNNYIGQCDQLCSLQILQASTGVITSLKLQNTVSETVRRRLNTSLNDMWSAIDHAEKYIPAALSFRTLDLSVRSCVCWMNELAKVDIRFNVYFSAIVLLQVARKISRNGFSDELLDVLALIFGCNFSQCCSVLPLRKIVQRNTSELVELLQKSAVEHLKMYRRSIAPEFESIATTVTTDFEALYAYKRGDYQRCLRLSTQNVHTLLNAKEATDVHLYPDFYQLMDDEFVSLTVLTKICEQLLGCRKRLVNVGVCARITQVTLSLYLMTQCQLKLNHSVTSLAQTLDYIKVAQRRHPPNHTCDMLTLKLIERKAIGHNEEPGTKLFSCTYNRPGSVHLPKTWTQTSPCLV